jgi:hypothetical protein
VAITNSFGMPSMDRDFLLADIPAAQAALQPGQVRWCGGSSSSTAGRQEAAAAAAVIS